MSAPVSRPRHGAAVIRPLQVETRWLVVGRTATDPDRCPWPRRRPGRGCARARRAALPGNRTGPASASRGSGAHDQGRRASAGVPEPRPRRRRRPEPRRGRSARRCRHGRLVLRETGAVVTAGQRPDLTAAPRGVPGAEVEVLIGEGAAHQAGDAWPAAVIAEDEADQLRRSMPDACLDRGVHVPELGLETSLTQSHASLSRR
jgi:hypothetical protein